MLRVAAYVDGFNLYYGLRSVHGRKYHWLDLQALAGSLLRPGQTLVHVTYFTARVRDDPDAERRQSTYLDALRSQCTLLTVVPGRFQRKVRACRHCQASWPTYEEKESDVSMAVALVEDAATDRYDTALLLSGDSDLCPAVRSVKRLSARRRVVAVFPPGRQSESLKAAADAHVFLSERQIRRSQLPPAVVTANGVKLQRPGHWS